MQEFTDAFFETHGVRLHYVEAGEGPLVIFYHGFPLFWFSFHHQLRALQNRFRVVAVDGPGINLSSKPDDLSHYQLPNLAAQLDALARHLVGDEKFYLVGHDWGGALAWSYAQAYEARLHKVVAINAPPTNQLLGLLQTDPEQRERSQYMYRMRTGDTHRAITRNSGHELWKNAYAKLRALPHFSAEHDETFRQGLAQPGAIDGGINWYRANIPLVEDITDSSFWPSRRASTATPALLIWGEADDTFVAHFIDALPQFASDLLVARIPEVGHSPMLEVPDEVTRILREFFDT